MRILLVCAFALTLAHAAAGETLQSALQKTLDELFPGEGWIALPYGSDGRFTPKSIWIQAEVYTRPDNSSTKRKWVRLSSGSSLYPEETVPDGLPRPIRVGESALSSTRALALAAAAEGALSAVLDGSIVADLEKSSDIQLYYKLGDLEEHGPDLFDMMLVQELNEPAFTEFERVVKGKFGSNYRTRTILKTLVCSTIEVGYSAKSKTGIDILGKLLPFLSKIGFSYNRDSTKAYYLSSTGKPLTIAFIGLQSRAEGSIRVSELYADQNTSAASKLQPYDGGSADSTWWDAWSTPNDVTASYRKPAP